MGAIGASLERAITSLVSSSDASSRSVFSLLLMLFSSFSDSMFSFSPAQFTHSSSLSPSFTRSSPYGTSDVFGCRNTAAASTTEGRGEDGTFFGSGNSSVTSSHFTSNPLRGVRSTLRDRFFALFPDCGDDPSTTSSRFFDSTRCRQKKNKLAFPLFDA